MIKILIVDDHPVVRHGVREIIGQTDDMIVAGEACDGAEMLKEIGKNDYDLIVLDISMPGKKILDVINDLKKLRPNLPFLILTIHPEKQYALSMFRYGCSGYLTKDRAPNELIEAIRKVTSGEKYISPHLVDGLTSYLFKKERYPHDNLSSREYQIMTMIAYGKTVKEIADELSISIKTVSAHRANILEKMNMKKNIEITYYAIQNALIDW